MTVNTPVTVPSGGDWRELQRLNLWQSPSPGSGSWREEANDAGVFLGVSGMVCPGDLYGSQWLVRVLGYHQHWAMTVPPDRTPPSPRDTGGVCPDDESPEFLGTGMPPGRRRRWEGLSGHQPFLGPPLLSDHQRAWARRHERWVRYGNEQVELIWMKQEWSVLWFWKDPSTWDWASCRVLGALGPVWTTRPIAGSWGWDADDDWPVLWCDGLLFAGGREPRSTSAHCVVSRSRLPVSLRALWTMETMEVEGLGCIGRGDACSWLAEWVLGILGPE